MGERKSSKDELLQKDRSSIKSVKDNGTNPVALSQDYVDSLATSMIGKGAFGVVFRATDETRQWVFALKKILYVIPIEKHFAFMQNSFRTEIAVSAFPRCLLQTKCCR